MMGERTDQVQVKKMRKRWDTLCLMVEARSELVLLANLGVLLQRFTTAAKVDPILMDHIHMAAIAAIRWSTTRVVVDWPVPEDIVESRQVPSRTV